MRLSFANIQLPGTVSGAQHEMSDTPFGVVDRMHAFLDDHPANGQPAKPMETTMDQGTSIPAQGVSCSVHQKSFESILVRVLERSHIRLNARNSPVIFHADQERATFMVEKTRYCLHDNLLQAPVYALFASVPTHRRLELDMLSFAPGNEQR